MSKLRIFLVKAYWFNPNGAGRSDQNGETKIKKFIVNAPGEAGEKRKPIGS